MYLSDRRIGFNRLHDGLTFNDIVSYLNVNQALDQIQFFLKLILGVYYELGHLSHSEVMGNESVKLA